MSSVIRKLEQEVEFITKLVECSSAKQKYSNISLSQRKSSYFTEKDNGVVSKLNTF